MAMTDLNAGTRFGPVDRGPLTVEQIALFADASGDRNPIHLDDAIARNNGLPGIIAHGMLTMAILADVLGEAVDPDRVRSFGVSFRGMAVPGDTLSCAVEVSSNEGGEAKITLAVTNQDGAPVLMGDAIVSVE